MKDYFRLKITMGYWSQNKEQFFRRKLRNTWEERNHRKYSFHFFFGQSQLKTSLKMELG